jgi:hypothetical protein
MDEWAQGLNVVGGDRHLFILMILIVVVELLFCKSELTEIMILASLAFVCRKAHWTPFGKSGAPQQKFRCTVEPR